MNDTQQTQMTPEEMQAYMAGSPTREEVNKYMNNLFMAINNSIGVFQSYTSHALASTMVDYLTSAGVKVTVEEFVTKFTDYNMKIVQDAQQKIKEAQEAATSSQTAPQKDINISVL